MNLDKVESINMDWSEHIFLFFCDFEKILLLAIVKLHDFVHLISLQLVRYDHLKWLA
jgi:hypothetical protein